MSLVQQSQQFYPTSVRVTVHQARNLRVKGKGGTNDAYAIIQVAKDKFSTSVSPKCVAPVWKEEASFDLPLFHPGNAERCTLYVIVMHRAQVGLDKFLGQAAVNLLELHDHTARPRTDWFSLVDKTGKADKARGEVLIDIQFMRNNMSASMFDLSMQDKPRSRISKLKDKVRGKRKDGFSDSASAIVPPVSQIVTDSEGEADACSLNQSPGVKKKSKLKSLFAPKSNLQRNISQSMSTLGTLPEKNSSLSGSRSSGLNVDSPEVKKKFKFLGHKRTGSSDSKVSQGPFSILSRSKQSSSDLNNLCINGSHVYAEETEPKSESTLSLNSSGQGSVEDVHRHNSDFSVDSLKGFSVPSYRPEAADKAMLERQRHQEEEERRQAEETRRVEANTLEEERCRAEAKRLHEEKERKYQEEKERQMLEEEKKRKKQVEEEEERQRKEEERRKLLAMENERRLEEERQRRQEEARNVEEQKPQDEASMSDRLSTLFGMIKKKDERKEESHQERFNREQPKPAPYLISQHLEIHGSHQSTNPFEEVPLSPDGQNPFDESPVDNQKPIRSPQTPSAMVFLNRTAKVSAVKPRLVESLKPELIDSQTTSQQRPPSPNTSESTLSSVPSESPDMFYNLHTSLAPPKPKRSSSESPYGSTENLSSSGSSPALSEKRRRAPMPPGYAVYGAQTEISNSRGVSAAGHSSVSVREIENPAYDESDGSKHVKRPPLPLPDYDTLFPQKRHGVQGQTRWDHIIAEVNQKQRDHQAEFFGQEMSVDEPEKPTPRQSSLEKHKHPAHVQQMHPAEIKPISSKRFAAPAPPQTVAATHLRLMADSNQKQSQSVARALQSERPNASAVPVSVNTDATKRESVVSRDGAKKALQPPVIAAHHRNMQPIAVPTPINQKSLDKRPTVVQKELSDTINKEIPTAKPRQKTGDRESVTQSDLDAKSLVTVHNINKGTNQLSHSDGNKLDKIIMEANEKFGGTDPFPCSELISKDTLARVEQNPVVDNLFTGKAQNEQKLEGKGMMADDMDKLFAPFNSTDPFSSFNANDSENSLKSGNQEVVLSQKRKQLPPLPVSSTNTDIKGKQEPALDEDAATVFQSLSDKEANISASQALQPKADVKTQSHWRQPEQAETLFREDPFASDPSTGGSSSSRPFVETPAELQQATMEESASQSGGRTLLRAWVSPSEGQPVSVQNSNGGGLTSTPRRPHPVKPMSSVENLTSTSIPAVREIKIHDGKAAQMKAADSVESGPYTQLTQEELITLVVKQQGELSKKDSKITELEEYIDNLLVRVIEEKPSILLALTSGKLT